jgi:hypothetical protein
MKYAVKAKNFFSKWLLAAVGRESHTLKGQLNFSLIIRYFFTGGRSWKCHFGSFQMGSSWAEKITSNVTDVWRYALMNSKDSTRRMGPTPRRKILLTYSSSIANLK